VCTVPGCPILTTEGRCTEHRREADRARGTASERGYTSRGHRNFRTVVLQRDPLCVVCFRAASVVADHWPTSRRELLALGLDANDPARGRGVCKRCHDESTAREQPGGFNDRR
jgi:5-methylcytosine-specific restriction protein A